MQGGRCRASLPKFYFDKESGECVHFIYGGCGGNDNRFETLEDCEKRCNTEASIGKRPKFILKIHVFNNFFC